MIKKLIVLLFIVINILTANAEEKPKEIEFLNSQVSKLTANQELKNEDIENQIEALSAKLEENKAKFEGRQSKNDLRISMMDSRLSDIWGILNTLGYIAALLGCLVTATVVFFSIKGTRAAIAEAREEVNVVMNSWLKDKGEQLLKEEFQRVIAPLREKVLKDIKDAATPILVQLDSELQKTTKLNMEFENRASKKDLYTDDEEQVDEEQVDEEQADELTNKKVLDFKVVKPEASKAIKDDEEPRKSSTKSSANNELGYKRQIRRASKLVRENHVEEAILLLESIVSSLGNASDIKHQLLHIEANYTLAQTLSNKLNAKQQAIEIYENLIDIYKSSGQEEILVALSKVMNQLAHILERLGKIDSAIATYEKVLDIYDKVTLESFVSTTRLIRAYNGLINCLYNIGNYLRIIDLYYMYDKKFGSLNTRYPLHNYIVTKVAGTFLKLGNPSAAINLLKDAIAKNSYQETPHSAYRRNEREKLMLAEIYRDEGDLLTAYSICDEVIKVYDTGVEISGYLFKALLLKASIVALGLGDVNDEVHIYDEIENLWQHSGSRQVFFDIYGCTAMVNKAITMSKDGKTEAALVIIDKVLSTFNTSENPEIISQRLKATKLKSLIFR